MQCKNCKLWIKRELLKSKGKKKEYYPTGRCIKIMENYKPMFTTGETHCKLGKQI